MSFAPALQEAATRTDGAFAEFFRQTPWIDLVGLGLLVLFLGLGIKHGLVWQVTRLLGMGVAVVLARSFSPRMTPGVQEALDLPEKASQGIVWFSIFVVTLVCAAYVGKLGRRALEAVQLGPMDRMGGALAGAFTGVVVHCALLVLITSLGSPDWTASTLEGSRSASVLDSLSRKSRVLLDAQAAERMIEPWGQRYDRQQELRRPRRSARSGGVD